MKTIFTHLALFALTGCATPDFNYIPKTMGISEPPLNSINTAYVGDVMLMQGRYAVYDSIYVMDTIDIGFQYHLSRGYYLKKGEDEKTETYYPGGDEEAGQVLRELMSNPVSAVMAYKEEDKICVVNIYNVALCEETTKYERREKPILYRDSFQQTLIYNGKVGNKINIGYREFSSSLARPAFNNNVEYDLSSSPMIGYRSARIEVIEATNEHIKYRIISNFNEANF